MEQVSGILEIKGHPPGNRAALAHLARFGEVRRRLSANPRKQLGRQEVTLDHDAIARIGSAIIR